ncbi:MAG: hypothetical protein N3B13_03390 [Deltaproteobacteria bacterium]|nr:hypothetical protein [Deltaproteobacteria bacterium]
MKVKVFTRNVTSSVPGGFENLISRYFEEEINRWLSEVNIQLVSIQLSSASLSPTSMVVMCMLFYKELSPPLQRETPQSSQQNNDLPPIER